MSEMINWSTLGFNDFMSRSLQAPAGFQTSSDYDAGVQDSSITNAKMRNITADKITTGRLQSSDTKTYFALDDDVLVVNDGTYDRVIIGKIS